MRYCWWCESWSANPPFFTTNDIFRHENIAAGIQGHLRVTVRRGQESATREIDLSASRDVRAQVWADAFEEPFNPWFTSAPDALTDLQFYYQEYGTALQQVQSGQAEVWHYSSEDLRGVRNILAKDYNSVSVYRVSTDIGEFELSSQCPHVIATKADRETGLTMMSLGEV